MLLLLVIAFAVVAVVVAAVVVVVVVVGVVVVVVGSVRRMQKCEASLLINSLLSMHSALSFRYCGSCCNVLSATAAQRDFQNKSYSLPRTLVTFYSQIDISIISAS